MALDPLDTTQVSKPPKPIRKAKAPPRFDKPEKTNWLVLISFAVFVAFAIAAGVWLFMISPSLPTLDCDTAAGGSTLTGFGGCHERQQ